MHYMIFVLFLHLFIRQQTTSLKYEVSSFRNAEKNYFDQMILLNISAFLTGVYLSLFYAAC